MKVLLAYEWCEIGGVETFMAALAGRLRARGHSCELFFFKRGPMEKFLPTDCPAHFGDITDCLKLVRARGFDLVHANSSDLQFGIEAVRLLGAKLVITAHGMVVPGWDSTNCDALVCCSRWQARDQELVTDLDVRLIMNGIDTDKFKPADDALAGDERGAALDATTSAAPIVAWVGRGTDMVHKRIDRLAAIAPTLRAAGLRIWIADPYGPEKVAEVAPEAAEALRPRAEFWGMVDKDDLPDFYRQVAASGGCILSTSVREGFGLVLAEAQACGCPAIGPDVLGVNEVVRPEHGGVLYPSEVEPARLAELVIETLRDTDEMQRRRTAAVAFVRAQFSLDRMAEAYMRVYEAALQNRPRAFAALRTLRLLPHWQEYVLRRWTAGRNLYEAARALSAQGETTLAARVARCALATCPTIFIRPHRVGYLIKTLISAGPTRAGRPTVKEESPEASN